jgi:hypothetical protein
MTVSNLLCEIYVVQVDGWRNLISAYSEFADPFSKESVIIAECPEDLDPEQVRYLPKSDILGEISFGSKK